MFLQILCWLWISFFILQFSYHTLSIDAPFVLLKITINLNLSVDKIKYRIKNAQLKRHDYNKCNIKMGSVNKPNKIILELV